jgi:hypothetical protein
MTTYPQKITFGELRASGVRDALVYCRDHTCSHHIETSADRWPDYLRLSDIEPDFVCTACSKRGAEVRPSFEGRGSIHEGRLVAAMDDDPGDA